MESYSFFLGDNSPARLYEALQESACGRNYAIVLHSLQIAENIHIQRVEIKDGGNSLLEPELWIPPAIHIAARRAFSSGALISKEVGRCLSVFYDDDIGEGFSLFERGELIRFEFASEDSRWAGPPIERSLFLRDDGDYSVRIYERIDAGIQSLIGSHEFTYESIQDKMIQTVPSIFPRPGGPVLQNDRLKRLWGNPVEIFSPEIFLRLIHDTMNLEDKRSALRLAIEFIAGPHCPKPILFADCLAVLNRHEVVEQMVGLVNGSIRPGNWVLPFLFNDLRWSDIDLWLSKDRPHSFVALESLSFLFSGGKQPLISIFPDLKKQLPSPIPMPSEIPKTSALKKRLEEFSGRNSLGVRERNSISTIIAAL